MSKQEVDYLYAADVGSSTLKALAMAPDQLLMSEHSSLQSAVFRCPSKVAPLSKCNFGFEGKEVEVISVDGEQFVIGDDVTSYAAPKDIADTLTGAWCFSPAYEALVVYGLVKTCPDVLSSSGKNLTVKLGLGLPQKYFLQNRADLSKRWSGVKQFVYETLVDGMVVRKVAFSVNFTGTSIIPQAFAAYFSARDSGLIPEDLTSLRILVTDIGEFSTDEVMIDNGRYMSADIYSHGLDYGVGSILSRFITAVCSGLRLDEKKFSMSARKSMSSGFVFSVAKGAREDVTEYTKQAVDQAWQAISGNFPESWDPMSDILLFAGGGAIVFEKHIREKYPNCFMYGHGAQEAIAMGIAMHMSADYAKE